MSRIKRRAARRLWRRSREEKRRLSEGGGGGGTTRQREEDSEDVDERAGDPRLQVPIETDEVTVQEIDRAYRYLFEYDKEYESLLLKERHLLEDIERLHQRRASLEDKILAIKMITRSFDSEKVKKIKVAERESSETWDAIADTERELNCIKLAQTIADAMLRACTTIVNQNVRQGDDDDEVLLLGYLGHVWRLEE